MLRRLAGPSAVVSVLVALAVGPPVASAAIVPNFFVRTCAPWGCSPFKQANGAYNGGVPSTCTTKNVFGRVSSSYQVGPGRRC